MQVQSNEKNVALSSAVRACQRVKVSAYRTVRDDQPLQVSLHQIVRRIQSDRYADLIGEIRNEPDKKKRAALKLRLPAFTASGIYYGKAEGEPSATTGFIQIDIDDLPERSSLTQIRALLQRDPYTFMLFTSPSGNGLKLLVRITTDTDKFLGHYYALESWYKHRYNIVIDSKCKNINRLCYFSHDPDIFIANSLPYQRTEKPPVAMHKARSGRHGGKNGLQYQRTLSDVEKLVQLIEHHQIDITDDYNDWIKIGYALSSEYGSDGLDYYQRISSFYPGYSSEKTSKQFAYILAKAPRATIASLFGIAGDYGVSLKDDAIAV